MTGIWSSLLSAPARRNLSLSFTAQQVEEPDYAPKELAPNGSYFQVRLAEMFLRDERELWRTFVPATLFVCDFKYLGERVRAPFFVSNRLLAGLELPGNLDKARIQFRDTRIVGPVPYVGDEVGILVALFRAQISDWRKSLFAVLEKMLGVVDYGGLAKYVSIADKLSDEILQCLGMQEVECVMAERKVYGSAGAARVPLEDGYFALLNCPEGTIASADLKVVDGRLHHHRHGADRPFSECDYCLTRLECLDSRSDYTSLPFHRTWDKARGLLLRERVDEAKVLLAQCSEEILASADLTEDHKYQLLQIYWANFHRDEALFAASMPRSPGSKATEPVRGEVEAGGKGRIASLRARAARAGAPHAAIEGLRQIEASWDQIVQTRPKRLEAPFDDAEIDRQLAVLAVSARGSRRDPSALVQGLVQAVVS